MSDREDLKARIDSLSETAVRFVARMVDSLSSPPSATSREPITWISRAPDWIEYFGLALSVHHGTTTDALGLNGFETAFGNACESVGWNVEWATSTTHRFSDLTVTDNEGRSRRLSLKSTAARSLSERSVHISKLILSQKVCAGRNRTNVPTPGYNIQPLFRILPQHTVALRCAKSLELPQNGFLRGNQS